MLLNNFLHIVIYMPVNLSNSKDIVANSVSVIKENSIVDLLTAIESIQGIPPTTLNTLEKHALSIDNNSSFYTTVIGDLETKADLTYVDAQLDLKADKSDTYTKTENNTALNLKANLKYVDDELALKADKSTTYT